MIHSSVVEKLVTIQDLRFEINSLKKEIQQLKACNHIIFKEIKDLKELKEKTVQIEDEPSSTTLESIPTTGSDLQYLNLMN